MKHIIKLLHRLTEDGKGVYFSCEENGDTIFVSNLKKNGMFHLISGDGAMMTTEGMSLFHPATQNRLFSFVPNDASNMYSGIFYNAGNAVCGNITSVGRGSNRYYAADIFQNHYDCYMWAVGTAPCMMVYKNGIQKAMLVEDKLSVNQMYSMTIHIADNEDLFILCMLGLIYHQFENVYNMNSRFHRAFIRNGWSISFCENVAHYNFEVPLYGIGKSKYNPDFLRQFYSADNYPFHDEAVTAGAVVKELGHGLRRATGEAWTEENLSRSLKNPLAIAVLTGVPIICGIIGGFIGPMMLLSMGIDIYAYSAGIRFAIGFFALLLFTGLGEGIFLLFFKLLTKVFGKKTD